MAREQLAMMEEPSAARKSAAQPKASAALSSQAALRRKIGNGGMAALRRSILAGTISSAELLAAPGFRATATAQKGGPCRSLMPEEIKLAKERFGDKISYGGVRICDGHNNNPIAATAFQNGNPAITLSETIYVGKGYSGNYALGGTSAKELFMHEMTHIWQYKELGMTAFLWRYAREWAASGRDAGKMYDYEPGKTPFATATLEAQAEMVGDYQEALEDGDTARIALLKKNLKGSGFYGL